MSQYRWDLHYLRSRHNDEGYARCEATVEVPDAEEVHHINGDPRDNRIDNLKIRGRVVRCEYCAHGGDGHASLDGSIQWTASPVAAE